MLKKYAYPMAEKEDGLVFSLRWTILIRKRHSHFHIRGLCMEVFQSYFKLTISVIPTGLQMHTISNWLCSGQMVNLLQIVSPKNGLLSWFSSRQIICFLETRKKSSVPNFSYLSYQYNHRNAFKKAFCECTARRIYSLPHSFLYSPTKKKKANIF